MDVRHATTRNPDVIGYLVRHPEILPRCDDRLEDFQRVLQPRVEALEKEALLDPKIRRELEHREFLKEYWRSCSAALAGTKLMIRSNDCLRGRDYCRLALLDDGVRLGTECYPGDKYLTVYLGVNGSAAPNQKRLFKQLVATQLVISPGRMLFVWPKHRSTDEPRRSSFAGKMIVSQWWRTRMGNFGRSRRR